MAKKSIIEQAADLFDKELLRMLRFGRPAFADGRPLFDDNGQQVMKPLTAAYLSVIRRRLANCHVFSLPTKENSIGEMVAELSAKGWANSNPIPILKNPPVG